MKIKRVVITFNILAIIFFLFTLLGKSFFEYAPLIGWIGGFISLTLSLIFMTVFNIRKRG